MNTNQPKAIVITPAIAHFEKLISEYEALQKGTHPELVKLQKEQNEQISEKFLILDNYARYQKHIIEEQCNCEIQSAQEEFEDFCASHPE